MIERDLITVLTYSTPFRVAPAMYEMCKGGIKGVTTSLPSLSYDVLPIPSCDPPA